MYHGAISTSQLPEVFEEEEEESSHDYFDQENRNRNRHDSGIEESFPSRQRSEFFITCSLYGLYSTNYIHIDYHVTDT